MKTLMKMIGLFALAAAAALPASAQKTAPSAVLEYFDNPGQIKVMDPDGFEVTDVTFGMELSLGDRVRTGETSAEIRLNPNGSILRLAKNSEFKIESVQGAKGGDANAFTLFSGKLRAVAAKSTGSKYEIRTPTAVCGVRGTDFGVFVVPGSEESVAVREGLVEFAKTTGERVQLAAGQGADVFGKTFEAATWSAERMASAFRDLDFKKLDPASVPKETPKAEAPKEKAEAPAQPPPQVKKEEKKEEPKEAEEGAVRKFLRDHIGMEVGSVTINEETYSRVIIQPVFEIGKFKASLYLPIIYTGDILDSDNWYRPRGNNEWSFGTDKNWNSDPMEGAGDLLRDLALKIRYVEYGNQRDPFFFKVGNLNGLTLGHGILVRNYANDSDFPAVRRVGVNLGVDAGPAGFEALAADLAEPEIFGGRIYVRPFHPWRLALGASFATDIDPAGDLSAGAIPASFVSAYQDPKPMFLTFGLDLDLPLFEGDLASLVLFGDAAGLVPYLRHGYAASAYQEREFVTDAFYKSGEGDFGFRNYALLAGLFGNLSILDWRLEYRQYRGMFQPGFFGPSYDRNRGLLAASVMQYLADPDNPEFNKLTMGIYGEAGITIFTYIRFEAGYLWPWQLVDGDIETADEDYLQLRLALRKGFIPFGALQRLSFYLSYVRTKFVPTVLDGEDKNLELFDANTVVKGELVFPVATTIDLALSVTTTVARNSDGSVRYDSDGNPKWYPSVGIETRIHF